MVRLPSNPAQAIRKIRAVTRNLTPDVVHAHSSWGGFYARTIPLPSSVVYQPHCYAFEAPNRSWVERAAFWAAEYVVSHRTSSVLTLSKHEMDLAIRLNAKIPAYHLPNVPTLPVLSPEVANARPYTKSVYMIGRVTPQKDPEFFISVANQVRQRLKDIEFVWIGDGETEQVEKLQAKGIRVTGWLSADALTAELSTAGVYLHTASYEGFPLSVLDAASQGVPIIARSIPCFNGTPLLQARDPKKLARHVIDALTNQHTRSSVIEHGYSLLKSMNEQAQTDALNIAYENSRK
nr:glycosyltransferase [Kocuria polaris]